MMVMTEGDIDLTRKKAGRKADWKHAHWDAEDAEKEMKGKIVLKGVGGVGL